MSGPSQLRRTLMYGAGLALLLTLCIDTVMLVVPVFDMQLYDRVLESRNMDTMAMLSMACLVGLGFYAGFEYLRSVCFVAIGDVLGHHLYRAAFREGLRLAASGDTAAGPRFARDVAELRSFVASGAVAVPLDALCTSLFVVVLFVLHPAFGFLALLGISGIIIAGITAEHLVHPAQQAAQARRRLADHALSRSLSDSEIVDGLGMLPATARRWMSRQAAVLQRQNLAATRAHWVGGVSRTFRFAMQASVMLVGALLVIEGKTTPGALMAANLLLNKALGPFDQIVGSCRQWLKARDAWRDVADLLAMAPRQAVPMTADVGEGLVVLDGDLVLPGGKVLLKGVNFRLLPGTLTVVAGPNGAGKTSLLRALAGLVRLERGSVWLDGREVCDADAIGYLSQTVDLLDGDVGENISRMLGDLPGAVKAARRAGLHEAVGRMSRGYETRLASNGSTLSGGMRQRVGLARALYDTPRLLLLDEPDASLDTVGSEALVRAVRTACDDGAIAVVISHRTTFQQAADLVLDVRDRTATLKPAPRATERSARLETA